MTNILQILFCTDACMDRQIHVTSHRQFVAAQVYVGVRTEKAKILLYWEEMSAQKIITANT